MLRSNAHDCTSSGSVTTWPGSTASASVIRSSIRRPSQYDKTAFSRTFDVTKLLREGGNAIGVELGRSYFASPQPPGLVDLGELLFGLSKAQWWEEPRLLAQLDVTLADGSTRRIATDGEWKIGDGPTRDALY